MELRAKEPSKQIPNIAQDTSSETIGNIPQNIPQVNNNYITKDDLSNMFNKFDKQINPDSALSPEVRSVIKAVGDVQGLRDSLKDPTSRGIEEATSTLVTTVLGNALNNMVGSPQQAAAPKPLLHGLAEIATHNISANLPQVLEGLKSVLGVERIQNGYDAGVKYIESKQPDNLVNTILSLDENNDEHVAYYAKLMGYTDINKAKTILIEHKVDLYQEEQEYQDIQQGQNQQYTAEENINEQQPNQQQYVEPQDKQQPNEQQYVEQQHIGQQDNERTLPIENEEKIEVPTKIHVNTSKIKLKIADEKTDEKIDDMNDEIDEIFNELTP